MRKTLGSANLPVRLKGISSIPVLMMAMFSTALPDKGRIVPQRYPHNAATCFMGFSGVVETLLVISVV